MYLPPSLKLTRRDILNLIQQLPKPFLLIGDFNAHNPIWGSNFCDRKGKILESLLNDLDLSLLNKPNTHTHFSTPNGTFSTLDLSISTSNLHDFFTWEIHDDLCSSDHFPITISIPPTELVERRRKWIVNRANWLDYQNVLDLSHVKSLDNVDNQSELLTTQIISAASETIPLANASPKRKPVPWWSNEISSAICARKKALRIFKTSPTNENLQIFRIQRAKCRRLIITAKRDSWQEFVQDITPNTPSTLFWKKIKSINGKYAPHSIVSLICNNSPSSDRSTIVNELGKYLSDV